MCANNTNDDYSRYSVNVQTLNSGKTTNGDLTYPIALLSADELVLAGAFIHKGNTGYYLYNEDTIGASSWWTMSPDNFNGSSALVFYSLATDSSLNHNSVDVVDDSYGARPVINLRSDILVDSEDGTEGAGAYKVRLP